MQTPSTVRATAGFRTGWGIALTFATRPLLRRMVRDEPHSGALVLFARTVGIRDLVFGAGCLFAALNSESTRELRRWLAVWLASDLADVVAGMTASRHVVRSGAAAAVVAPLPFIATGIWALRRLPTS